MNNNLKELNKLKKAFEIALIESKNVLCKISKDKTEKIVNLSSLYPVIDIIIIKEQKSSDIICIKPKNKLMLYQKEIIKGMD